MTPASVHHRAEHLAAAGRSHFQPGRDLIRLGSRRWFVQCGLAGIAGLSAGEVLRRQAEGAEKSGGKSNRKAVILFWLSGGPSQLEFWDPKPDAPVDIRGPFGSIGTKVPGLRFGEYLPKLASIADQLNVIRSVDCSASDDHRAAVMQTGNSLALSDLKITAAGTLKGRYPAMGSIAARFRGPNDADLPPFVGLGDPSPSLWHSDIWNAGELGSAYEPVAETGLAKELKMPAGISTLRAQDRDALRRQFDGLRRGLESRDAERLTQYDRQALEMVLSGKAQKAFDVGLEPEQTRAAYGRTSFGEKTLLARRLVEVGVTFVVVSGVFGRFDNHGDDVIWGGLEKGLKPLFPGVDQSLHALVTDLASRGLLESTLILAMGEFGRSPLMTKTGGRTHYPTCMSVVTAGGKCPSGQVIGSTDEKGFAIKERRIIPADLAATVYRHLEIDLSHQWTDPQGRPHPIVSDGGEAIKELG